ncbi:MAG: diguanylate cyclase (GGDEF)-like protein [Porticoccus sp.]|jgi:diguanylate cyclase (GGDEF)-like protein
MKKTSSIKITTANMEATIPTTESNASQDELLRLTDECLLKLHQRLQGTLDTGTLINRFFSWLGEQQLVGGIEYIHPDEDLALSAGSKKHHNVHYVLRLEKNYLGEITITRQTRFFEQDLFTQEQSIDVLVHYLKNAIAHQALEKVASHDSLTGIMNRTALDELLPKETKRAQRYGNSLSLLMIDIDNFKSINDRIGHIGGDAILKQVSQAIQSQLRNSDLLFRYGGDEFLLILPNTHIDGAHKAAQQIMVTLNKVMVEVTNQKISPKLSIGVATYQQGESYEKLIRRVDIALYEAKNNGRNCIF